ncbi:MAG TPA: hypothetical protein VFI70_00480 [Nitrososphaeraceae archaeon]|nr:hypothetical protein [Nitrososphaeraceae archaeon]
MVSIGIRDDYGTAFFHTYSSGDLGIVNNLLVISRSNRQSRKQYDCTGNGNGSVIGEKIDPFVFIIYDENSILITFLIKIHSLLPLIW